MNLSFEVPLRTKNTGNQREHWRSRHKRTKSQRGAVAYRFPKSKVVPVLIVLLTRVSPRALDVGDNLSSALKSVRDEVARQLGIDDRSKLVRWYYDQAKGDPAVRVEIGPWVPHACDDPTCWRCGGSIRPKSPPGPEVDE